MAIGAVLAALAACGGSDNGAPVGYVYVASADSRDPWQQPGSVYQYAIAWNGLLTPLSVAGVPAGVYPTDVVSDPAGHYVYVVNRGDATISQYAVENGGALMELSPATVDVPEWLVPASYRDFPVAATVDPSGRFLYVEIEHAGDASLIPPGTSIAQYSIGSDGTLMFIGLACPDVPASAGPLTIDASGHYAYIAGTEYDAPSPPSPQVFQFSITDNGALVSLSPPAVAENSSAFSVTIAPHGHTAYILSPGQVAQYAIGANGALQSYGPSTVIGPSTDIVGQREPATLAIDSSGFSAYLLTNPMSDGAKAYVIYQYAISASGVLLPNPSTSIGSGASFAERIHGSDLYVLSSGHIDHYSILLGRGLSSVDSTPVMGGSPTAMALVGN